MKIVVVYGVEHHGTTWHVARGVLEKLGEPEENITEFYMPRDMPKACNGCGGCFHAQEPACVQEPQADVIRRAMREADLLVFASPVYVYHVPGPMKSFLDHYGCQWLLHRPEPSMAEKTALILSTCAGAGTKSANKDVEDSMTFWGVGRVIKWGGRAMALNWQAVTEKTRANLDREEMRLSDKLKKTVGSFEKPRWRVRFWHTAFHLMHKKTGLPEDIAYWKKIGWLK